MIGSWGQRFHRELLEIYRKADHKLRKGENPDEDGFSVKTSRAFTEHVREMREKGITRVFLCGVAYNICVYHSALAYAEEGFEAFVIRNATRSVPPPYGEHPDKIRELLWAAGVKEADLA